MSYEQVATTALHYAELGRYEQALQTLHGALRDYPEHTGSIFTGISGVLAYAGRYREAEQAARNALRHTPSAPALSALGQALLHQDRYREALPALQAAVAEDPQESEYHADAGAALRGLGRLDEAQAAAVEAQRLDPNSLSALYLLGRIHLDRNQPDAARAAFQRGLAIDPHNSQLHNALARASAQGGDWGDAVSTLHRSLAADPHNASAAQAVHAMQWLACLFLAGVTWLCATVIPQLGEAMPGYYPFRGAFVAAGLIPAGVLVAMPPVLWWARSHGAASDPFAQLRQLMRRIPMLRWLLAFTALMAGYGVWMFVLWSTHHPFAHPTRWLVALGCAVVTAVLVKLSTPKDAES